MSEEFYPARMLRADDGRVHWFQTVERTKPSGFDWLFRWEYETRCNQRVPMVAVRLGGPIWEVTCPDCLQAAKEAVGG